MSVSHSGKPQRNFSGGLRYVLVASGGVLAVALAFLMSRNEPAPGDGEGSSISADETAKSHFARNERIEPGSTFSQGINPNAISGASPIQFPPSAATVAAEARVVLDELFALDLKSGKLTPQQITLFNDSFKRLSSMGPAAVPVIREFLERNVDLDLASLGGAEKLDYSSLRVGLFDALKQIGGAEGIQACLEILQQTADPWEVAILGKNLEEMAPGQFREETRRAALESLTMARNSQLPVEDVAPLFQVLQSHGNADIIADLEKSMPQWSFYSAITLASLPDGAGIPVLIEKVQNSSDSREGAVALQILAQVSPTEPRAAETLIAKAQANQISDAAWPALASSLAGLHFEFGTPLENNPVGSRLNRTVEKSSVDVGIERLFTLPTTPSFLEEQLNDRMAMIDRLLTATSQPAGIQALESARAELQRKAVALVIPQ